MVEERSGAFEPEPETLVVEAADVSVPASSMVEERLVVSALTSASAPEFCACRATTGRSGKVVGEVKLTLALRAYSTRTRPRTRSMREHVLHQHGQPPRPRQQARAG